DPTTVRAAMVTRDLHRGRRASRQRKPYDELAALARPGARCGDRAGVQADEAPDEAEPDAKTSRRRPMRGLVLAERIEDPSEPRPREANAPVLDSQDSLRTAARHHHRDPTAERAVLDRVVDEVDDDLFQPHGVTVDQHRVFRDVETMGLHFAPR